jgi:hypothetical protein
MISLDQAQQRLPVLEQREAVQVGLRLIRN